MSEFWIFFEIGLKHILNLNAYDHILFLIALTIPFLFKDWKQLFILVSTFTLGHCLAMMLSVFGVLFIKGNLVEFIIPITIFIISLFNLFTSGKSSKQESISVVLFVTLLFGIIHGLSFASHFKTITVSSHQSKWLSFSEFALGIEASQIIVVFVVLVISYLVQTVFRFPKRDWTLVMSSFIIGVVLPMILKSGIFNK